MRPFADSSAATWFSWHTAHQLVAVCVCTDGRLASFSSAELSASAAACLPRNQRSRHQNVWTITGTWLALTRGRTGHLVTYLQFPLRVWFSVGCAFVSFVSYEFTLTTLTLTYNLDYQTWMCHVEPVCKLARLKSFCATFIIERDTRAHSRPVASFSYLACIKLCICCAIVICKSRSSLYKNFSLCWKKRTE